MKNIFLLLYVLLPLITFTQENTPPANNQETATTNTNTTTVSQTNNNVDDITLNKWTEIMNFGISPQRIDVVKKIRADKPQNTSDLLKNTFTNDNNTTVKEEIIYALTDMKINDTDFWDNLFTTETDLVVLQRAAYAVELLEVPIAPSIANLLSNHITNTDAMRFNAAAVRALGALKHTDSIQTITDIATNRSHHNDLRGSAVVALGMFEDPELIPTLHVFLTNSIEPRIIRRYAALAIGKTKDRESVNILTPIITNESEEQGVRLNAMSGLSNIPDEDTVALMQELARSDNTAIRTEAVKNLGKMISKDSQQLLEFRAFNDPEPIVRRAAKTSLQELGFNVAELEQNRKNPPQSQNQETNQNITNTENIENNQ